MKSSNKFDLLPIEDRRRSLRTMTATLTFQKSIDVPHMCELLNIQNVVTTLIPYRGITPIPIASKLVRPAHPLVHWRQHISVDYGSNCLRLGITASEEALPVRLRGSRRSYQVARQFFDRLVTGLQAAPDPTLFDGSQAVQHRVLQAG